MGTLTFTQALTQAEAAARSVLSPALHERLSCAVALVQSGQVFQADDGQTWEVASQTTPGQTYSVNGACGCDDAHFRPGTYCKHQLAVFLCRKVLKLMQAPAVPGAPEQVDLKVAPCEGEEVDLQVAPRQGDLHPLPEAPASVNVRLTIHGRDCQITLRDTDEARLLQRLAAVLAQYPAPAPQAPTQGQGQEWCSKHGVALKLNHGKDGRTWLSHRTPEGQWCKGK